MKRDFFYQTMGYPTPSPKEYFYYKKKVAYTINPRKQTRTSLSPQTKEFLQYIRKWSRIWKYIPFIQSVYLCNSLTFNALKKNSDIDIVIIAKTGMVRRTRFWSVFVCKLLGIMRTPHTHYKKFCLSFYLDENNLNIDHLRNNKEDFYLTYWLAHLIPRYQETINNDIFDQNKWLHHILPNHPMHTCIDLTLKVETKSSKIKKILEQILSIKIGKKIQKIIKYIRIPIMLQKKKKLGKKGHGIIISDTMLKFYEDKRILYNTIIKKKREN